MVQTNPPLVVSDAGPLIHLDEIGSIGLLSDFGVVLIPSVVWGEVIRHRPGLRPTDVVNCSIIDSTLQPTPQLLALADSLGLDIGEREALALMENRAARVFLCDDAAARLVAESLGFSVHGTIGVLVRSVRQGTRTRDQVLQLLRDLPHRSTLHIARKLLDTIITKLESEWARA